mmetsp:Transcript_2807/g.5557  ORF Transcript_2807/g.5557 Transcript_2807/m.5557 type:complete len:115 (-) Transcript_2807:326-670(-)
MTWFYWSAPVACLCLFLVYLIKQKNIMSPKRKKLPYRVIPIIQRKIQMIKSRLAEPSQPLLDATSARLQVERQAVRLLRRVLGQVLEQQQHQEDEGFLGNTLDEEWAYLQQFRQ